MLKVKLPLKKPYILSFATINQVTSVIVRIMLENGSVGIGEAVALPGYSHETTDSIIADLRNVLSDINKINVDEIETYLIERIPNSPFAISAILTAKEIAGNELFFEKKINIPLVAPISSTGNLHKFLLNAHNLYKHGYRTIKLKVGKNIEQDCSCVSALLNEMPEDVKIRIDANQGYNFKQACCLSDILQHNRNHLVECLEQPFEANAWQEFHKFTKNFKHEVPLMLDESIVVEDDVEKAVEVGADQVKLKLYKHRGITGLILLAKRAKELGLKVVIGNGVASEIGNLAEAVAFQYDHLFMGAFEGNGFTKLTKHILCNPPKEEYGNMKWKISSKQRGMIKINQKLVQIILENEKSLSFNSCC